MAFHKNLARTADKMSCKLRIQQNVFNLIMDLY